MARNKVIYGGEVLIDLTGDTVTRADVQDGVQFHLPSGEISTGTSTKDSDTSDATAQPAEILSGKTAYARGTELTGTMPNNGAVDATIDDKDDVYTVPQGYHDGSGTVHRESEADSIQYQERSQHPRCDGYIRRRGYLRTEQERKCHEESSDSSA